MIFSVLFAAVLAGIVVAIARRAGGSSGKPGDPHGVRRFFQYLLLYALFSVAASGLAGIAGRVFGADPNPPVFAGRDDTGLARDLSFVLIGAPLYAALGWWSLGRLRSEPTERRSLGWLFYSTVAPTTALVVAMSDLDGILADLFGAVGVDGRSLGSLVVWGGLWVVHWLVIRRFPSATAELPLLVGSGIGLVTAAIGLSGLVTAAIDSLIPRETLVAGSALGPAAATFLVGAAAWIPYWWAARAAVRSPLWRGYVFVLGVAGGLVAALTAAGVAFRDVLVWWIGEPRTVDPGRHFDDLPRSISAVLVGAIVWWYHRAIVTGREEERTEPRRVYEYLMAGIGLLAAAGGLATLLVGFLEAVSGAPTIVEGTAAINTFLGAATFLIVGAPVWWYFWKRAEAAEPESEVSSPTRRIYLFTILGISSVAAVVALITAVFIFLEDLLGGTAGVETLRSVRIALASLVTAGVLAGYHWAVYRADRRRSPEAPAGPRFVLLIGPADDRIGRALRERTGAEVRVWARTDPAPPWSVDEVVEALSEIAAEDVVVVVGPDGVQAMGVDRD